MEDSGGKIMFIHFDGKGCRNCPFLEVDQDCYDEPIGCWLNEKEDISGCKIKVEFNCEEAEKHKPKGCPFSLLDEIHIASMENE
jgi:hypothetical protein